MNVLSVALLLPLAAGCASSATHPPAPAGSAAAPGVPPEITKALASEYRIASQDLLDISVYEEPDLSRTFRVSSGGTINYPLVGEVDVVGLTPLEVERKLGAALNRYVVAPYVSVDVKEYHARRFVVLGEVGKPGAYDLPSNATLSVVAAIAMAGGFTKYASPNSTRVVRKTGTGQETLTVPVGDVTKGDTAKDLALQPEDVIFVPQTLF